MKSNDIMNRDRKAINDRFMEAVKNNDSEAFLASLDELFASVGQQIRAEYEEVANVTDRSILAQRGVRQLTTEERDYYKELGAAMLAKNPKQALTNLSVTMPVTIIEAVFDELENSHPLLQLIDFRPTTAAYRIVTVDNGEQQALWGELCDDIVKELLANFVSVDGMLMKLSAFLPVCKAAMELGPEWLDRMVRQVLVEALRNGLEAGIVAGTGNKMPIGMNRQVGENVTVTGGVYPLKEMIKVNNLDKVTYGRLLALLAVDPSGKARRIERVVLIVNPADYFAKVMPATTIMAPDGTYRSDVMPFPTTVVQSSAVEVGEAIVGLAYRYIGLIGAGRGEDGVIEYSDHYQFLEDNRVYLIKLFANGMPKDNNAFLRLDISDLVPTYMQVETITPAAASADATLVALRLGSATLSPAFAAETTAYTATTSNASNTINAVPADAGASIEISVTAGGTTTKYANGQAITWAAGENVVTVNVTAEDGTATKAYTVTVTKS